MIRKVCFVLSPCESAYQYPAQTPLPPISMGILSGYLAKKGLDVEIHDLNSVISKRSSDDLQKNKIEIIYDYNAVLSYLNGTPNSEIDSLIASLLSEINIDDFDILGVSLGGDFSFMQIHIAFLVGKFIEKKYGKTVLFGGGNINYLYIFKDVFYQLWETILKQFNFVIKGAGEKVIWDIICGLNQGKQPEELRNIRGLVNLNGRQISDNPEYAPEIVKPSWDGMSTDYYSKYMFDETDNYKNTEKNMLFFYKWPNVGIDSSGQLANYYNRVKNKDAVPRLMIPYIFNFNCPYKCAFCTQSDYDRGSVIGGEVGNVFNDITTLMDKYNTKYFYFLNNAFNYSVEFSNSFCRKVIHEGTKFYWSDCARFNNMTYERLELMRKAGCIKLTFGFETGSPKILNLIDKKLDISHSEQVLKWCHELGIWADIEIIVGLPQETAEDFKYTYDYIEKNREYINYFWVNEYFVVPNSLIGKYPERYGIKLMKDYTGYEELLKNNRNYFSKEGQISTKNAKLYGFNELEGREYEQILLDNNSRISILNKIQRNEFNEVSQFYRMLLAK